MQYGSTTNRERYACEIINFAGKVNRKPLRVVFTVHILESPPADQEIQK